MTEYDLREAMREQAIRRVENQTIPRNPFYPSYPMDEYPSVAAEGRAEDFMGTIRQGPTGFMANYITPMIDSLEQPRMGGPDGVSTADLMNFGMLGAGIGGSAIRPRPSTTGSRQLNPEQKRIIQMGRPPSGVPTPPRSTSDKGPPIRIKLGEPGKQQGKPKKFDYEDWTSHRGGVGPDREVLRLLRRPHPGMNVERRAALQEYMERMMAGTGKYFPSGK